MKAETIHRILSSMLGAVLCYIALHSVMSTAHSGGVLNMLWAEKENAKAQNDLIKARKYQDMIEYYTATHEKLTSGVIHASAALGFCGLWLLVNGTRGLWPTSNE